MMHLDVEFEHGWPPETGTSLLVYALASVDRDLPPILPSLRQFVDHGFHL